MNGILGKKVVLATMLCLAVGWTAIVVNGEEKAKTKVKASHAKNPAAQDGMGSAGLAATTQSRKLQQVFFPALTKRELKIQEALNAETECHFEDLPLSEVVTKLSERHELTFLVRDNDLGEEGLTVDEPINFSVKGITLKDALDLILEPIGLTYLVDRGVVIITTVVKADEKYKTRVYPVGDFGSTPEVYQELISTIENDELGTIGTISPVSSSKALVIRQTYHAHNAIVDLLTQLRQARALE